MAVKSSPPSLDVNKLRDEIKAKYHQVATSRWLVSSHNKLPGYSEGSLSKTGKEVIYG